MRAEVKHFEWPDLERGGTPASEQMSTPVVFAAGPVSGPGEEIFEATVCTPDALAHMIGRDGVVIGRHLLLVASIDVTKVENAVRDHLRRIDGASWTELAEKIGRIGLWEFEDYAPAR